MRWAVGPAFAVLGAPCTGYAQSPDDRVADLERLDDTVMCGGIYKG
jgi:hypothetical protein